MGAVIEREGQKGALPTPAELAAVLDEGPAHRKRRLRWVAAGISACVLASIAFGVMQLRQEPVTWRTDQVRREDLHVVVDAVGSVQPREVVSVGSEQSGIAHEVFVEEDERVIAGQPLLALDPDVLSAQEREAYANVAALRASVSQARAVERQAVLERDRAMSLSRSDAIAQSDLDAAKTAVEQATAARISAEAQASASRARLGLASTYLGRSVVRSPIDGVVLTRNIEPGQAVVASFQSVTLFEVAADLAEMTLEVDIDEADVPRVMPGQVASFSVPAWPDREFRAIVTQVHLAPNVEGGVVTYQAELSADNPDGALRPGMTATAHIQAEEHLDSLTVPLSALRFEPNPLPSKYETLQPPGIGQTRLWRLVDGEPEPVLVGLGPTDGMRQAITGGLSSGETVIVGRGSTP